MSTGRGFTGVIPAAVYKFGINLIPGETVGFINIEYYI